jgi:ankyrin repeat protein
LIKSADPNVVSVDQNTPLMLAVSLSALPIFETLLRHPWIDVNKETEKGTALHIAVSMKKIVFAQKLLDNRADARIKN